MIRISRALTAILLLCLPFAANAEGPYVGGGLSLLEAEDEVGDSIEPTNVYGLLGYDVTRYLGFESQLSVTVFDDSLGGVDWSAAVFGVYLKGILPVTSSTRLVVLGGVSNVEVTADIGCCTASDDDSGTSYGLGADFRITENVDFNLRYMKYLEEDGLFTDVSGLNLGASWRF